MIKYLIILLSLTVGFHSAKSQDGIVPKKVTFAGMTLELNNAARGKIQAEVNRIRKSEKHFQAMVDKANIFFPVVEEVFRQENFPDDIKYLLIQESAFNADAVSSSNAVGFWQFKEGTAKEVGLQVDGGIDERKNLAAASRGAAKYMTKTNLKVKNWVYALLSYNVGPGGVMSHVKDKYVGANKMDIDGHIHWYVIKFLAHKIAYEGEMKSREPSLYLSVRDDFSGENLKHIAKAVNVELELLEQYNRWISSGKKIPNDRKYSVIVPSGQKSVSTYVVNTTKEEKRDEIRVYDTHKEEIPAKGDVAEVYVAPKENIRYKVNGVEAIVAIANDNSHKLALAGDVSKKQFIKYNEIQTFTQLIPGVTYFLGTKKNSANVNFHTVKKGQTIWDISQLYAVKTKAIRKKNRMRKYDEPEEGRVLWLRNTRPEDTPITYRKVDQEIAKTTESDIPINSDSEKGSEEVSLAKEELSVVEIEKIEETIKENDSVEKGVFLTHEVEVGETLYGISKKYGVSIAEIKDLNALGQDNLSVGMLLKIKQQTIKPSPSQIKPKTYIVKQGDTFYSISKKFNIGVPELLKKNNKTVPSLSIGEELIVE